MEAGERDELEPVARGREVALERGDLVVVRCLRQLNDGEQL